MRATVWGCLVAAFCLVGCVAPGLEDAQQEVPIPPGQGQLTIRWNPESGGRALLGSTWAAEYADAYELVLLGTTASFFELNSGSNQVVAVDPGTYRLVVLAGVKRSSGSATAYLVGSALAESVAVVEGQRTAVNLVIKSVDVGWATSGAALWKAPLTVTASGKSRNPRVGMSLAGASTTQRPRFKSVELWNGYKEMSLVTGTPDDWTAEATGTVPDQAPALTVGLVGAGLVVQTADGSWLPLAGLTGHSWFWPNRPDVADTHPLAPWTQLQLAPQPPPTGVEVGLGWE